MPMVNGKKFAYTEKGKMSAKEYAKMEATEYGMKSAKAAKKPAKKKKK